MMYEVQPTVTWNRDRWYENKMTLHTTYHSNENVSDALFWSPVAQSAVQQSKKTLVECQDAGGEGLNDQVSIM